MPRFRDDMAATAAVLTVAVVIAGCAWPETFRPHGSVTIYGRNERAFDAWFGLVPLSDPPQAVGFGQDAGVACLAGPIGSEIAWFDGSPGSGGRPVRPVGTVRGGADMDVLWVEVAIDGSLTTGPGVPDWWVGDEGVC